MYGPNSSRFRLNRVFFVSAVIALSFMLPGFCWSQAPGILSQEEEKPSATVKVEVKESGDKKAPEVKVEVEGKGVGTTDATGKDGTPLKILPDPNKRLSPVDTEPIDKAGRKIGRRLDETLERISQRVGGWVKAKAFNDITWFKLIASLLVLVMVFLVQRVLSRLIQKRLQRVVDEQRLPKWSEVLGEALSKPLCLFLWVYGTYAALTPLFVHFEKPLGANVLQNLAKSIADIGGLLALVWFIYRVIKLVDVELERRAQAPDSRIDDMQVSLLGKTLRWAVGIVGSILILQYITGLRAGPLIASLGIGGLAIALAAKESLENLFGTATIVFDKPFRAGDRVKIDSYDGFVEEVGYRSTKIRVWDGNLVNIPNEKIVSSNVENFARRPHIRWRTDITITYDTPPEKVDRAVSIIQEILENDEDTSKDSPPWVFFDGFNDWSLNIRVMAWFKPAGMEPAQFEYYTWRQRNCRHILRRFAEEGIQFAFPTRTTYLAGDDERRLKIEMMMGTGRGQDVERTG